MMPKSLLGYDSNFFEIVTDKLKEVYNGVERSFISFGYARAAGERARMRKHEDAKRVIMHLKEIK